MIDNTILPETAVLVGVISQNQDELQVKEYLDELQFLADTAGAIVVKRFTQRLQFPNPRTFVGEGKLAEIAAFITEHEIDMVIFDDELSPGQLRNLDKTLGRKVLDRTNLILDIFAKRAQTAHAKTQVELAQLEYMLPRLVGMWTHLERQRGGIGMRGPGEREIETDRRIIRDRIALLKEQLKKIDRQMATQRKSRESMIRVSLVGYTNVGKSTIMNLLSKSSVFAENKLFATLDTTVRKVVIGNLPFLLSDTVGFIRKLPHNLVESFKSTLDELRESDILLHVVDISHPAFEDQMATVKQTIHELKASEKPTYIIFNKIDAYTPVEKNPETGEEVPVVFNTEELKRTWMATENNPCIFISATEKTNLDDFRKMLYDKVRELHVLRYPYDHFLY
jgi:GTP-binding protein HflX